MRSPITRLAAAAVVIIATVIAMSRFGGSTGGVVWAEVVRNVEASPDFIFRMKQIYNDQETGTKEFHMTVYGSVEYGMRTDGYLDPEHPSQTYGSLKEEAVISVTHSSKTYARMPLTADQLAEFEKLDVKRSIRKYVSGGYKKLGRRTIEGVEAEGIEVDDPSEAKATFPVDSFVMQLWVAVDTGLPVLMEAHTMGKNGTLEVHTVQDNFQWNVDLDEGEFLPDIPEDYSQMEVEIDAEGRTTFKTPVTHDAQEEAGAKIQKWRFRDKHPEWGYRLLSEDGQSATNIPESWADSPEHAVRIREELDHLERQAKGELVEVKEIEVNGQLDYRILMYEYSLSDGQTVRIPDFEPDNPGQWTVTGARLEELGRLRREGKGQELAPTEERQMHGRVLTFKKQRFVLSDGTEVVRSVGRLKDNQ